jgi:hypothetical protein
MLLFETENCRYSYSMDCQASVRDVPMFQSALQHGPSLYFVHSVHIQQNDDSRYTSTSMEAAATCSSWFLALGFFYLEDGGDTFLRNIGSHKIHGATSQNTQFFIIIALKTSNLTRIRGSVHALHHTPPWRSA